MTTQELDSYVSKKLRGQNETERALHEPSGKLSAGMLSQPLLEQCLKLLGVPPKPIDDYTLRLFERGKQVEAWLVNMLDGEQKQTKANYRDVTGYIDLILDGKPVEIKSVKSSQWRWLEKDGVKWGHQLQAGLYALATDSPTYQVIYVSADDFRMMCFELQTADIAADVDGIISEVTDQLKSGLLPLFEAREKWQADAKYSNYPEWISLSPELAMTKLKNQFPDSYKKLTETKK